MTSTQVRGVAVCTKSVDYLIRSNSACEKDKLERYVFLSTSNSYLHIWHEL